MYQRVVVDVTPAVMQAAGIGRYCRELVAELVSRESFEFRAFVTDSSGEAAAAAGALVGSPARRAPLPDRWMRLLWYRARFPVPVELFAGRFDLYHATDFLVPPHLSGRAVVTVHDLSFLRHPELAVPRLGRHLADAVPRAVRSADHVLADSGNTRRDLIELAATPPEKVTVAHPGIGPRFYDISAETVNTARRQYNLDKPYILGVGTLEPRKNWEGLIAAFTRMRGADHALVIAGRPGWRYEPILAAAADAVTAGHDVRLIGFVPDDDLPALYSGASVFAYPSYYEGFGFPPLESMAAGTPTIVSDASCLPEVVGDAALVVRVGDVDALAAALEQALGDEKLRESLRKRGPEQSRQFTWERTADVVESVYRHVLG